MEKKLLKNITIGMMTGLALSSCSHPGPESLNNSRRMASIEADQLAEGRCYGVNECRGLTNCGGEGHSCSGKNTCKGEGWSKMTRKNCEEEGGSFRP
jgi:hypothetical protein